MVNRRNDEYSFIDVQRTVALVEIRSTFSDCCLSNSLYPEVKSTAKYLSVKVIEY